MRTIAKNCETEQSSQGAASRAQRPSPRDPQFFSIVDASRPSRLSIQGIIGDRPWLVLNVRVISAETVKRMVTMLVQEGRLSEGFQLDERYACRGRVWLPLQTDAMAAGILEHVCALLAKDDRRLGDLGDLKNSLSINDLAAELDVTRRTIERALKDGVLVPTAYKKGRVAFSREYTDRLKERAREARLRGITQIMGVAAGTGPIVGVVRIRRTQVMTAQQWAQMILWKRRHLPRQKPRPKAIDGSPAKFRPIPVLTPEEIEARARLAADRAKLAEERERRKPEETRRTALMNMSLYKSHIEPDSRDQALRTTSLLLKLVRAHPGEDAARIEQAIDGFRDSASQDEPKQARVGTAEA